MNISFIKIKKDKYNAIVSFDINSKRKFFYPEGNTMKELNENIKELIKIHLHKEMYYTFKNIL